MSMLLLLPGAALAQEEEPTVNDSDYDTSVPSDDEAYLNESEAEIQGDGEPMLSDSDFDTSVPQDDTSYLDEAESEAGIAGDDAGPGTGSEERGTPSVGLWAMLAALAGLAIARRR